MIFMRLSCMRFALPLAALLFGFALFGCGGGTTTVNCSNGNVISTLTYETVWSGSAQSQIVTVFRTDGTTVSSRVLNRADGDTTVNYASIDSGTYRILSVLYSARDGGGSAMGQLEALVPVCGSGSFRSRTSGVPTHLVVTPGSATIKTTGSQRFYAYAANASDDGLFSIAGSTTWSASGGAGSIDSTGLFTPTAAGTVNITASQPGGISGMAALTVSDAVITHSKWTILVYLNAANDLYSFSTLNVNQMEQVAQNSNVRFVLQWKQSQQVFPASTFDGTRRMLVKPDTSGQVVSTIVQDMGTNVDMGDPQTLRDFLTWGQSNYPSDRTLVIIWNHGNGWLRTAEGPGRAVSYDDQTGNSIQIDELPGAFAGKHFDAIAWDASLMQMLEVAYEIKPYTDFVIGSEESPPGEGYPYHLVFSDFRDHPDKSTHDLTENFVTGMMNNPPYVSRKITQSVLKSTALTALASSVDSLASQLSANAVAMQQPIIDARNSAQSFSPTSSRYYRDLDDLCSILIADSRVPAGVKNACANVQSKIASAVIWEGHNSHSPNSHGVAIDLSPGSFASVVASDYARLQFAHDTTWDNWLLSAP